GFTHSWRGMEHANTNPLGVEWFGLTMGLGFVLSFGYWCTDFLVVQRAMAADSEESARKVPLIAAIPKMFFPFLVILPGLIAVAAPAIAHTSSSMAASATVQTGKGLIPVKIDPRTGAAELDSHGEPIYNYDLAIPTLLLSYYPTGILGLGLTALLASFMSGMAGNVTAFNAVWTYDIYQSYLNKNASDKHYLLMGRWATVGGVVLSVGAAYLVTGFNNIMDTLQLVFSLVNAPLFATFLLGMFWKRTTGHGAFAGLVSGTTAALVHHGLTLPAGASAGLHGGWIAHLHTYPSEMAQNFWTAIVAFTTNLLVTLCVSLLTKARQQEDLVGLVYSLTPKPLDHHLQWYQKPMTLGVAVLAVLAILNFVFA
ncbi:MAG: sodium:solute symporter family transporter, partial [Janthinobacterium lividum]